MPIERDKIWKKRPRHTETKHNILKKYLQAWFPILGSKSEKIVYIDGFAGAGKFDDGSDGSPIIALNAACGHGCKHIKRIDLKFIEEHKETSDQLKKHLQTKHNEIKSKYGDVHNNVKYDVINDTFFKAFKKIMQTLDIKQGYTVPIFAFLDPYGFSGLDLNTIREILSNNKCEILFTYMVNIVIRRNTDRYRPSLDKLHGGIYWEHVVNNCTPSDKPKKLLELIQRNMTKNNGVRYMRTFEMKDSQNNVIYYLVYATNNLLGLEKMKSIMFKLGQADGYEFSDHTDPQQSFLIKYNDDKVWLPMVIDAILKNFAGDAVPLFKIKEFVLTKTEWPYDNKILTRLKKSHAWFKKTNSSKSAYDDDIIMDFTKPRTDQPKLTDFG